MTRLIDGLAAVAGRYDVLLCDVWGVIHDGRNVFEPACAALRQWRQTRGPVILISNAPRLAAGVAAQLESLGAPREAWSEIVTSGDVTRELLAARAPGPAWRIGPPKDDALFEGLGLEFVEPNEARFIACSGPNDEDTETPEDYRDALTRAARRGLPMICANPDIVVQRGDRLIYCGGALAQLYEMLAGTAIMAGKPFAPIYELALKRSGDLMGSRPDRSRVLAVGDGLATDILGAERRRLDALFIADGVHAAEFLDGAGNIDSASLAGRLAPAAPAFAMKRLVW